MSIINEMRTAISCTNAQLKDVKKAMERNREKYSEFIAKQSNDKLLATAAAIIDEGRKVVEGVYNREIKAVRDFYTLDASMVTDDVKLLDGHFNLSANDVAQLLVKYQKNGTMTAAVVKYADEHGIGHYEPSKATREKVLTDLKASAMAKLDKISEQTGIDDFYVQTWPSTAFGMGGDMPADYSRVLIGLTLENISAGDDAGGGDNG